MILRYIPFANGHATFICPFFPTTRAGARRYRAQIPVCRTRLYSPMLVNDGGSATVLDVCINQATFFSRAAMLPWAAAHLGALQLQRIRAASLSATWQAQREALSALHSLGLISEGESRALERDLQVRLAHTFKPDHPASTARTPTQRRAVPRVKAANGSTPRPAHPTEPGARRHGLQREVAGHASR